MKIVFFGTSDFAVPSLSGIRGSRHQLLAVVTQPDRGKGRKLVVSPPPVKTSLEDSGVTILQPAGLSEPALLNKLEGFDADLFVVVEYGQILKPVVLDIPKEYCVNLHASILPKYRGAAPINHAIINGERETGVCAIKMDEGMDTGDIMMESVVDIRDEDDAATLRQRLALEGAALLVRTLDDIEGGKAKFTPQDEKEATYAPKLTKHDGHIDWSLPAAVIHNRVRGLLPWPSAYTCWNDRVLKIYKSSRISATVAKDDIGRVLRAKGGDLAVGTGSGELIIRELQLEGGRRLDTASFLRGHKLTPSTKFT